MGPSGGDNGWLLFAVAFDRQSADLDVDANRGELAGLMARSRERTSGVLLVEGYTAPEERDPMALATARAEAVRRWLTQQGVPAAALPHGVFGTPPDDDDIEPLARTLHELLALYREQDPDYDGLAVPSHDRLVNFTWIDSGEVLDHGVQVRFDEGSDVPDAASGERLAAMRRALRHVPPVEGRVIVGHAAPNEPDAEALAVRRAERIRDALDLGATVPIYGWVPSQIGGFGLVVFDTASDARTVTIARSIHGGPWLRELGTSCPLVIDARALMPSAPRLDHRLDGECRCPSSGSPPPFVGTPLRRASDDAVR